MPPKAKSQEPVYSQALIQNIIDRQRVRSRESGRQTVRRLWWMVFGVETEREAWACAENFLRGTKYLRGGKFEIDGTATNEGAENKNKTANSVIFLLCLKFLMSHHYYY